MGNKEELFSIFYSNFVFVEESVKQMKNKKEPRKQTGTYFVVRDCLRARLCRSYSLFYAFFQDLKLKRSRIGKISNLPSNISKQSTSFANIV